MHNSASVNMTRAIAPISNASLVSVSMSCFFALRCDTFQLAASMNGASSDTAAVSPRSGTSSRTGIAPKAKPITKTINA